MSTRRHLTAAGGLPPACAPGAMSAILDCFVEMSNAYSRFRGQQQTRYSNSLTAISPNALDSSALIIVVAIHATEGMLSYAITTGLKVSSEAAENTFVPILMTSSPVTLHDTSYWRHSSVMQSPNVISHTLKGRSHYARMRCGVDVRVRCNRTRWKNDAVHTSRPWWIFDCVA